MRVGRHLPPFWGGPLKLTVRLLREHCHVCPVCNVGVLWPNCWMDQDFTWYRGRPRLRRHCVRRRNQLPHGQGHSSPQFSGYVYCVQTVAHRSNCCSCVTIISRLLSPFLTFERIELEMSTLVGLHRLSMTSTSYEP